MGDNRYRGDRWLLPGNESWRFKNPGCYQGLELRADPGSILDAESHLKMADRFFSDLQTLKGEHGV